LNNLKNLRGTVDLLPDQLIKWQNVEKILLEQLARASIKEIRTPILEMTELFIRGIGEGTDVVSKEMYTFLDRGERSCTLRPEGTASVARALIQNGISSNPLQKLWYMGPMFRYERPQAGRQRQFHQLGVEFIGYDSVRSDIEIEAKEILRIKDMLNMSMSDMTGQSFEKIEKDTDRDYFLSAEEAKNYGLIDRVITHPSEANQS